jgi:hypothetical protein
MVPDLHKLAVATGEDFWRNAVPTASPVHSGPHLPRIKAAR